MSEILAAVMGTHDVTSGAGCAAERGACPRSHRPELFLDQRPRGFDGIEVVRVRRRQFHRGLAAFDDRTDHRILVRVQVVQHHDVARPQVRHQTAPDPVGCVYSIRSRRALVLVQESAKTVATLQRYRLRRRPRRR